MTLSVAIQHHPERANLLPRLVPELEHADALRIVVDPQPYDALRSAWRTYVECVKVGVELDCDHHLIVQDDAVPCPHAVEAIRKAIEARPDAVVAACVCGNARRTEIRMCDAWAKGWAWADVDVFEWCPTVATWYPQEALQMFAEWIETRVYRRPQITDDTEVSAFLQHYLPSIRCLATVPCLFEHPDDTYSMVAHGSVPFYGKARERIACCPIGSGDALAIDWSRGP